MKNFIKNTALALVAAVLLLCTSCSKPSIADVCAEANKNFPQTIDNGLTIVSVSFDDDYFIYNYSNDESVLTAEVLKDEDGSFAASLEETICEDKDFLQTIASYERGVKWNITSSESGDNYYFFINKDDLKELAK